MSRQRKQTVDYFPHSCTHKTTMFILEQRYGNDGYAFWFKLLEMLGQAEGHYLDLNKPATWEFLQSKTHLSNGSCDEVLGLLARLEAIDPELWEQKVIWCQNFVDGISVVYRNRRVETPDRPYIYCKKPTDTDQSTPKKPQSRVEESRVEESRVDTTSPVSPPESATEIDEGVHPDTLSLYGVLEQTSGFPKYSNENALKLQETLSDYPGLDHRLEFKKFKEYWDTRKLKRPWLALRNWLDKAKEANSGKTHHSRQLPKQYEPTRDYPDL